MPRKKPSRPVKKGAESAGAIIGEEVRIAVMLQLKKFLADPLAKECEFPSSLYAEERAYIHELAKEFGLRSKSRGKKGVNRAVTVYKREGSSIVQADPAFTLNPASRQLVKKLLMECPLTNKERQDLLPQLERDRDRDRAISSDVKELSRAMGRLSNGVAQVPVPSCSTELLPFRQALPIWNMRDEIMRTINSNQVVIIAGETGSGKTTQVPQFILEHCQSTAKPCRIVCTEPRRISAVSVSDRVSAERDEKLGQSVGYQIRLESRVSPKTVLTYSTNGVLLRTLMGGDSVLATMTHIIVDEVHERDRFSDFLLIALRDALTKFRMLRLVLMSATVDTDVFTKYFNNCPVITVPGRQYEVKEYFLEDILKVTGYMSSQMAELKKEIELKKKQKAQLEGWTKVELKADKTREFDDHRKTDNMSRSTLFTSFSQQAEPAPEKTKPEPWLAEEMDRCIEEAWITGSGDAFSQLLYYIHTESVSVDYQHSQTSATALMVAAGRGCVETTEQLLNLGANTNVRASNNWTAVDWALHREQTATAELIRAYMKSTKADMTPELLSSCGQELSEEDQQLLEMYLTSFNDDTLDVDLCFALISYIHSQADRGSILVFLPGYDVITTLRDRINSANQKFSNATLYTLHSNMQTTDQKRVFQPAPPNTRKIILSTNIAETSITIDDVVYVIDCGKVKEKSFDAVSGISTLCDEWISQACSKQRKGRAGRTRPGICYHMFSSLRYRALQEYPTPEILRMPLQELCLHTKLLAPSNTPIADFLARAMEPPPFMVTRNAVQLLKTIDALDPWEDLTELGHHLLDLPIEPRLGKMLLHSVVLKCLDPVLTIVCTLAYKDPFILPAQPNMRRASRMARNKFSAETFSDHMALLRAFQAWQMARATGRESGFCHKNFISSATMEQVMALRAQLLGQLRASGFVRAKGGGDIRDLNSNAENWAVVKAALTAGFYPNLARVDREAMQLRTMKECSVFFHPSSTLRDPELQAKKVVEKMPTDWLVYEEMSRTGRFCHIRMCTLVSPITVALFGGPMRLPLDALSSTEAPDGDANGQSLSDSEWEELCEGRNTTLKLDDWIMFCVDGEAAHLALQLRQKWNSLFLRRMRGPAKNWTGVDDAVVQAIVRVLTAEEKTLGLQQPEGIGQRPRPLNIDFYPSGQTAGTRRCHQADGSDGFFDTGASSNQRVFENSNLNNRKHGSEASWSSLEEGTDWLREMPQMPDAENSSNAGSRYFIIKAGGPKAIEASLSRNGWAFTPSTERKIVGLFKEGKRVVLIFSMQGSGSFQGVAQLVSDRPDPVFLSERCPDLAGPNLGTPLPVEWIKCSDVPFQATRHLVNPFNENRRVQTSRDGQELEPSVAVQLCSLWDKIPQYSHMQYQQQLPPSMMRQKGPQIPYHQQHHYYQNQGVGRPIRGGFQNGGYAPHSYGQHSNSYGSYGRNSHHTNK